MHAKIRLLLILFCFSVCSYAQQDSTKINQLSTTKKVDTINTTHKVHIFWQVNSFITQNLILNTQIRIIPRIMLSVRTGYKFNSFDRYKNASYNYGVSEHRYSLGFLTGIKLLYTFQSPKDKPDRLYYLGLGFDFDSFTFPLTQFLMNSRYCFLCIIDEDDASEFVSGKYQTYTLYAVAGLNKYKKFLSNGFYAGLGIRLKYYQANKHYWNGGDNGNNGIPIPGRELPKYYQSIMPFIMVGVNIGK